MGQRLVQCWRTGCGFARRIRKDEATPAECPLCGYDKSHLHPGVLKDLDATSQSG